MEDKLPNIEFEGKLVKPKGGAYKCPYSCGDHRYPAKKWKTENGFRKHMTECPKSPSAENKRKDKQAQDEAELERLKAEVLAGLNLDIDQRIYYVKHVTVKDTHEWRGNRQVRVRYEAVIRFDMVEECLHSITFRNGPPINAEYVKNNLLILNGCARLSDLCATRDEAIAKARKMQEDYDRHVEFSSACR